MEGRFTEASLERYQGIFNNLLAKKGEGPYLSFMWNLALLRGEKDRPHEAMETELRLFDARVDVFTSRYHQKDFAGDPEARANRGRNALLLETVAIRE